MKKENLKIVDSGKRGNRSLWLAVAVGLVCCIGLAPVVAAEAEAALGDDGFCIVATYAGEKKITGNSGNCATTPVGPTPTPTPTPVEPVPDYTAAGICAAPGSDDKLYTISGRTDKPLQIAEYSYTNGVIQATDKSWNLDKPSGQAEYNGLGLTRRGTFYFAGLRQLSGPLAVYSYKPGASSTPTALEAHHGQYAQQLGEAMVYKGVEEYYYATFAYMNGKMLVSRYSPTPGRSGMLFDVKLANLDKKLFNGDFAFSRNGDLRVISSSSTSPEAGYTNVLSTIPFASFADLQPNRSVPELQAVSSAPFNTRTALNGVAFLPDGKVALSSGTHVSIWDLSGTPQQLSEIRAVDFPTDLANCQ